MSHILEIEGLSYSYRAGERVVPVLRDVSLRVEEGEFTAIQGPSGSGKSTLFYILGGLLRPNEGRISLDGSDMARLSRDELAILRNRNIGFVFQQFHLLPGATVLDNILLPCRYPFETEQVTDADRDRARRLAKDLGIEAVLAHRPNELSGGQQQRVAIARALMRDVKLILADEPTGSLDSRSAAQTMDLLRELNRQGRTILLITHDNEIARSCRKVLPMRDGKLGEAFYPGGEPTTPGPAGVAMPAREKARAPTLKGLRQIRAFDVRAGLRLVGAVLPMSVSNLLRNKMKSTLTMLGVIIGVAAVLAMLTLGNFTKRKILESYETLGVNRLGIAGYPNWERRASDNVGVVFRDFNMDRDIKPLPRIFPEIRLLSPLLWAFRTAATYGGVSVTENVRLVGVNHQYFGITNTGLIDGAPITAFHVENRSRVCVMGPDVANQLFRGRPPLGEMVQITLDERITFACRVIGITQPKTTNQDFMKPNFSILVPYTYFETMEPGIDRFIVQARPGTDIEASSRKIKAYFEQKYGASAKFMIDNDAALVGQMRNFLTLFTILLAAIALLSLVVGGIGINNMMLVSISERLREIGLRKALGATDRSLRYQMLTESMTLCLTAGLIGLVSGFVAYEGLIYGVSQLVPKVSFAWVFEPWAMWLSMLSMLAVGLASGIVPAVKAQRLEVIEALRSE